MPCGTGEKAEGEGFAQTPSFLYRDPTALQRRGKNCDFSQTSFPEPPYFPTIPFGGTKNACLLSSSIHKHPTLTSWPEPILGSKETHKLEVDGDQEWRREDQLIIFSQVFSKDRFSGPGHCIRGQGWRPRILDSWPLPWMVSKCTISPNTQNESCPPLRFITISNISWVLPTCQVLS